MPDPDAHPDLFDVAIVGGGAGGLSAALVLGRCGRHTLILDEGLPRNRASRSMHNYLTRDGVAPREILALGRAEVETYGAHFHHERVVDAVGKDGRFTLTTISGAQFHARKIILATGVIDILPEIPGLEPLYGRGVYHCPYCDAHEHRDRPLATWGEANKSVGLALCLRTWSNDVVALMDDDAPLTSEHRVQAKSEGIELVVGPVARLEGESGMLARIILKSGRVLKREALFFNTGQRQASDLARRLGCKVTRDGDVLVDDRERTCIPGVCLVGDASKDVQFVIVAAAEGATAAVAINAELQNEDRDRRASAGPAQPPNGCHARGSERA